MKKRKGKARRKAAPKRAARKTKRASTAKKKVQRKCVRWRTVKGKRRCAQWKRKKEWESWTPERWRQANAQIDADIESFWNTPPAVPVESVPAIIQQRGDKLYASQDAFGPLKPWSPERGYHGYRRRRRW